MKRAGVFAIAAIAPLALGAVALALEACSSDNFATADSGPEGGDVTVDVVNDAKDDRPGDSGTPSWCDLNASSAWACADFDTVDAASALKNWSSGLGGGATFAVGQAPDSGVADGGGVATSPPNQLVVAVPIADGGEPPVALLSTTPPVTSSLVSVEFGFLPPTANGGAGQVIEFASVNVLSTSSVSDIRLALAQEGPAWEIRVFAPGPTILPIPSAVTAGVWHRIRLVLDKGASTYQLFVDGKALVANTIVWPANVKATSCQVGALQLGTIDTAETAHFDNVVCLAQ